MKKIRSELNRLEDQKSGTSGREDHRERTCNFDETCCVQVL